jgi:hypothetical protein
MELTGAIATESLPPSGNPAAPLPLLPTLPEALLPTLPEAPLPTLPSADTSVAGSALAAAALAPDRPNLAGSASYGALPGPPRAGEPSPAVRQAAEQRRRAKKQRRTRRIVMLVVALAVAALAGPPTVRWIADGLAEAGSTETEAPPAESGP